MSWTFAPVFDAAHRAALATGKPLVYVAPPAAWTVLPLLAALPGGGQPGLQTLVLVPDPGEGMALARIAAEEARLAPVRAASGAARTGRLLAAGAVRTLATTPAQALDLARRATLKLEPLARVIVLWPELQLAHGAGDALDAVLAECGGAQRLVATGDERAVGSFLERHARRAPLAVAARAPTLPVGPARYATVSLDALAHAVRAALDHLDPDTALIWDPTPLAQARWAEFTEDPTVRVAADPAAAAPAALAIAAELPTAEALAALRGAARDVLVLVRAAQLPYLQRLAEPLRAVTVTPAVEQARDADARMRAAVRERLGEDPTPALLALAPLFDEFDPALVAAALYGRPAPRADTPPLEAWVRLRLDAGRRARLRTGDVVGALLNAVGLPKEAVGRVDVRDSVTLVEVQAEVAEAALRGLDGLTLRGRTVAARLDRR